MKLGELIRAERKSRKVTLEKLAKTTGLDIALLSEAETGIRNLTREQLKQIAKGLTKFPSQFEIVIGRLLR